MTLIKSTGPNRLKPSKFGHQYFCPVMKIGTATRIPIKASPVINPDAMRSPRFSDASEPHAFLPRWLIMPPKKMGTVKVMGK